ncbi:MAG: hypothetical protein J3K34DRAFT_390214 [Monoraphidium minutum]|nr:MAG: hypothetical protein J3K34DRAFT_390214 [Monoraphidium minutum]
MSLRRPSPITVEDARHALPDSLDAFSPGAARQGDQGCEPSGSANGKGPRPPSSGGRGCGRAAAAALSASRDLPVVPHHHGAGGKLVRGPWRDATAAEWLPSGRGHTQARGGPGWPRGGELKQGAPPRRNQHPQQQAHSQHHGPPRTQRPAQQAPGDDLCSGASGAAVEEQRDAAARRQAELQAALVEAHSGVVTLLAGQGLLSKAAAFQRHLGAPADGAAIDVAALGVSGAGGAAGDAEATGTPAGPAWLRGLSATVTRHAAEAQAEFSSLAAAYLILTQQLGIPPCAVPQAAWLAAAGGGQQAAAGAAAAAVGQASRQQQQGVLASSVPVDAEQVGHASARRAWSGAPA